MRELTYYGDHVAYISDEATDPQIQDWIEDAIHHSVEDRMGPLRFNESWSIIAISDGDNRVILTGDEDYIELDLLPFNPIPVV